MAAVPGDARTLPALRALYREEIKRWDLSGLRDALLLGLSRGDVLAPSLLLSHSAAVRPSPEALAAVRAVSDEKSWRIGHGPQALLLKELPLFLADVMIAREAYLRRAALRRHAGA